MRCLTIQTADASSSGGTCGKDRSPFPVPLTKQSALFELILAWIAQVLHSKTRHPSCSDTVFTGTKGPGAARTARGNQRRVKKASEQRAVRPHDPSEPDSG